MARTPRTRFRISDQQREIMRVVSGERAVYPSAIIARELFGTAKGGKRRRMTDTERASLGRSLTRLCERGLLLKSETGCYSLAPKAQRWLDAESKGA